VWAFSVALTAFVSRAEAEAATFVLAGGESKVQFVSDAPLERITGATTRVTGKIELDPAAPGQARGEIAVPVAWIRTNNDLRDEHLRSDSWLDAARFPNVQFTLAGVSGIGALSLDQSTSAEVRGKLSVHGVVRELAATAKVRLSQADGRRTLRVQAQFPVALEAHDVSIPSLVKLKVAPVIQVNVDLYAHAGPPAVPAVAAVEASAPQARPSAKPIPASKPAKSAAKSRSPGDDAGARQDPDTAETKRAERSDAGQAEASATEEGDASPVLGSAPRAPPPAEPRAPAAASDEAPRTVSHEQGCSVVSGTHGTWLPLLCAAWLLCRRRRVRVHADALKSRR
jgi:polyisoprenoid-binding protein YceI